LTPVGLVTQQATILVLVLNLVVGLEAAGVATLQALCLTPLKQLTYKAMLIYLQIRRGTTNGQRKSLYKWW
jgi:hypothetical protein